MTILLNKKKKKGHKFSNTPKFDHFSYNKPNQILLSGDSNKMKIVEIDFSKQKLC